jgi:hypothetical protein
MDTLEFWVRLVFSGVWNRCEGPSVIVVFGVGPVFRRAERSARCDLATEELQP